MSEERTDQAIYMIAKELMNYFKERGGQIRTGVGLGLSIVVHELEWLESEYNLKPGSLSGIVSKAIELSHNEIAIKETVAQKNVEKITIGLLQRFEITNQALRGVPVVPAPDLGSSSKSKKSGGITGTLKKIKNKIGV